MKKLLTVFAVVFFTANLLAINPEKMSYQALIRDFKGQLVTSQAIGMRISIYYYSTKVLKTTVYSETQTPKSNDNGLVTIEIGTGTALKGIFAEIDWPAHLFYIKTEIDPEGGTTYSIISETQLLSVPYALHAKTATTAESTNTVSISGRNVELPYCADIDGNVYKTVKIGNQVWMAENLKVTRYRNGEAISNVKDAAAWKVLTTGAWCDYDNFSVNGSKYGHLYNWYAVADSRNIAPEGWHVPTDAELTELENYLIANGGNFDRTTSGNKIAKSLAATTDWVSSGATGAIGNNPSKNNLTNFSALPAGVRYISGTTVGFSEIGNNCSLWSATPYDTANAIARGLNHTEVNFASGFISKKNGYIVRCLKD